MSDPTSGVLAMGHDFKMIRIDAAPITTQVIKFHAKWDWTDQQFPRHTMSAKAATIQPEQPVPVRIAHSDPLPAVANFDLVPEAVHP